MATSRAQPRVPGAPPPTDDDSSATSQESQTGDEHGSDQTEDDASDDLASRIAALEAKVEGQSRTISALVNAVRKLDTSQAMPKAVELPEMADVERRKPAQPVLTKQGWWVPQGEPAERRRA